MSSSSQPASIGLSGGDWTRLNRLHSNFRQGFSGGSSIIQRPASFSTDRTAALSTDFVTRSRARGSLLPVLTLTRICSCIPETLNTKITNCRLCAKNGKR